MRPTIPTCVAIALLLFTTSCTTGRDDAATEAAVDVVADTPAPLDSATDEVPEDPRSTGQIEKTTSCAQASPSDIGRATTPIRFYATCGDADDAPFPIYRDGESFDLPGTIRLLTAGLSDAERAAGLFSWFDADDEITGSATVDGTGTAVLRFEQNGQTWRPAASASYEVLNLIDSIAATVFAHSEVEAIDRSALCFGDLDCEGAWQRNDFEQTQFLNRGVIATRTCGIVGYWDRPELCSVDGIRQAEPLRTATVVGVADDDTLNLRAGPSADSFIVSNSLRSGAVVELTEVFRAAEDGGLWRLIFDEADRAGWVNSAFLALELTEFELTADRFVAFARAPSPRSLAELPFSERVQLGLGPELLTTVDRADLENPDIWVMDAEYFRAYVGPFSILEPLERVTHWEVEIGRHKHCVGDPMPVPDGLESATIVSIQPAMATIDTCLRWFAVDLFVGDDGRIRAVTFDTWEP